MQINDFLRRSKRKVKSIFSDVEMQRNISLSAKAAAGELHPDIRGTEETIEKLLSGPVSMSRLGDGEFMLIFGEPINYQRNDPELGRLLEQVLHSNVENHIVCISDVFGDMAERSRENREYWTEHLRVYRHKYYQHIDMKKTYYNTSATRVYKLLEDKSLAEPRFAQWKKLWDGRDVVFIEGEKTRMGVGNDLFDNARSVRRIIGPPENAFSQYGRLLQAALQVEEGALFILALGPTATVLSCDLASRGRQALDLGHIDIEYEWFLRQNSNTVIEGKYVNEVAGGNQVSLQENDTYNSQIIWKYKEQI